MKSGAGGRDSCQARQLLLFGTHLVACFVCLQIEKGLEREGLRLSLGLGSQERTFLVFLIPGAVGSWSSAPSSPEGVWTLVARWVDLENRIPDLAFALN